MRIITLALALFTFSVHAQTFPSPYCDIDETTTEEITLIDFAGISITNSDSSTILIDKTDTVIDVTVGETYTIIIKGNTYGEFDNNITAFIDWDQNAELDDEGEIFEIGTITDSTGDDEISVSMEITIPEDAELGETRVRITKVYTDDFSIAVVDPCAISMDIPGYGVFEGFGQALDFTINIEEENAGGFPSPYCDIVEGTVEEITSIDFAGTNITNTDTSSLLVDKTDTVVTVNAGETYTIEVAGNTYGEFDNNIVAFIDWNQNELLDDEGEIYEVGTITDSNGNDGVSVTMEITIPEDAVLGETRIRVTKVYTDDFSVAVVDPCAISMDIPGYGVFESFGQAIDFTLNVEEAIIGVDTFNTNALSIYPVPTADILNITYQSDLTDVRIYNLLGQEVLANKPADSQIQLDVSSLASGTYIVKLSSEKEQHSLRIIKL